MAFNLDTLNIVTSMIEVDMRLVKIHTEFESKYSKIIQLSTTNIVDIDTVNNKYLDTIDELESQAELSYAEKRHHHILINNLKSIIEEKKRITTKIIRNINKIDEWIVDVLCDIELWKIADASSNSKIHEYTEFLFNAQSDISHMRTTYYNLSIALGEYYKACD
jgi:hypothetical protein